MRRSVFLLVLLTVVAVGRPARAQVRWGSDLAAARKEAARVGRPVLLDFRASWCGPCLKMERETFSDPTIAALLGRMVCVRVDVDEQPALARTYGIQSIPRLIVLPAKGDQPLLDLQGFAAPDLLLPDLRRALGMKADAPVPLAADTTEAQQVLQALQGDRYAALRAANPALARKGLRQVIERLGVFQEEELERTAGLLRGAGGDLVPALLDGMGHRYLAVRAGAYRTLQAQLRESKRSISLTYDPWASPAARENQLRRWRAWWQDTARR